MELEVELVNASSFFLKPLRLRRQKDHSLRISSFDAEEHAKTTQSWGSCDEVTGLIGGFYILSAIGMLLKPPFNPEMSASCYSKT